jgi:hypothetical protein
MASDGDAIGNIGAKPSRANGSNSGHSAHITAVRRLSRHFREGLVGGCRVHNGLNMLFYPLISPPRTVAAGVSFNADLH